MRGIRFVTCLVFGLSVGLVGCDSQPPAPTIDPGIVAALAPACSGNAVPGAGYVATSGSPLNHLVLLDSTGHPFDMSRWLPVEWQPTSLSDAEIVACAAAAPVRSVLEVCPYTGSDITRYEVMQPYEVVEAGSGRNLAFFQIVADPRECGATEEASLTELEGVIDAEMVTSHLIGFIEHGRFIDPDAPGASINPGKSSEPGQTTKPGQTTEPTGSAEAVELRQALADSRVSVAGTGDGLQSLDLELNSEVDVDLDVTIEAGTLLEPRVNGTQTMVVTAQQVVYLVARGSATASLDVACVEMHQEQPTGDDRFHVLSDQPANDLLLLLAAPDFSEATGRVQQFAVWTITNNPKRNGYVGLTSGFDVFGSGPDDEEIAAIRDLFDAADIDMGKYRALR
jgi:hypothetical protein